MAISDLQKLLAELAECPATRIGQYFGRDPLFDKIKKYQDLDTDEKGFLAQYFIQESCSRIGASRTHGDLQYFLLYFAEELDARPNYEPFGMRKQEHLAFAIRLVSTNFGLAPGGAVGAFYLMGQLEVEFRNLSGHLEPNGGWKNDAAREEASSRFKDRGLSRKWRRGLSSKRINDVALTYKIFLLNDRSNVVKAFASLEEVLPKHQVINEQGQPEELTDIGDRLAHLRHPSSHGFYGDVSSEGYFYALLWALIYFHI